MTYDDYGRGGDYFEGSGSRREERTQDIERGGHADAEPHRGASRAPGSRGTPVGYVGGGIGGGAYAGGYGAGGYAGPPYGGDYMIGGAVGNYAGGFGGRPVPLAGTSPGEFAGLGPGGLAGPYAAAGLASDRFGAPAMWGHSPYPVHGAHGHTGRGPYAGCGPRGYRRSDERIEEDINEWLTRHPDIDAHDIEVRVEDGEVTLTGEVDDRRSKRLAEDIAESCAGVADIRNELRISRPALSQRPSAEREVRHSLSREESPARPAEKQRKRGTSGPRQAAARRGSNL